MHKGASIMLMAIQLTQCSLSSALVLYYLYRLKEVIHINQQEEKSIRITQLWLTEKGIPTFSLNTSHSVSNTRMNITWSEYLIPSVSPPILGSDEQLKIKQYINSSDAEPEEEIRKTEGDEDHRGRSSKDFNLYVSFSRDYY